MKVRGSRHNTGEVLFMALELGAKPSGQWQGCHAIAVHAEAPDVESGARIPRYGFRFGITINALGERFFDEGESDSSLIYAKFGNVILGQPRGVAYHLFDRFLLSLERNPNQGGLVEAATVAELAAKLHVDVGRLTGTVQKFNAAIKSDIPFDRTQADGRGTAGLEPNKSNWALPLEEPPFFAQPVTGGITFTFGGLQVNGDAQVIGVQGRPIPGFYASGDILGIFYDNYPTGSGQARNLVFSRLAAKYTVQRSERD